MSKDKGVVDFTPDGDYKSRIEAAKGSYVPVGGAPMPTIPRLDSQPPDPKAPPRPTPRPTDLLTPEARAQAEKEGRLIPGVGSAYVMNQPLMNAPKPEEKQDFANPPRPEGAGLRPETVEQLKKAAETAKMEEPEEDKIAKELGDPEAGFPFDEFSAQARSLINNKERRKIIEARITDRLDIEDLLVHLELRQQVPIIPGRFVPTFRSVGGHEDLWIKRQMGVETGSETYITDRYAMMNMVAGLYAINGKILGNHLDKEGMVDQAAFDAKYRQVLRYPWQILADLSVNYVWFCRRVERAIVVDDIKGF